MIILISSSRTMKKRVSDNTTEPFFLDGARELQAILKNKEDLELKQIFQNNNIEKYKDFLKMDLDKELTRAIDCYDGVVFRQFNGKIDIDYLNRHLRIISALYGLLRPSDGIVPYRLEMSAPHMGLYEFWSYKIYEACRSDVIINLASREYARVLVEDENIINIDFQISGKRPSTKIKQARGLMVKYLMDNKIEDVEQIKYFNLGGFIFDDNNSNDNNFVFIK